MLYLLLAITQTEKVMSDNLWVSWYYHIRYLYMKLSFKGISIKDVPRGIIVKNTDRTNLFTIVHLKPFRIILSILKYYLYCN